MFTVAFPGERQPVTFDNVARALGAFERMLVTPSRWDAYLTGKEEALTKEEKIGLNVFLKSGCVGCHHGPYLGGTAFQIAGVVTPWPDQDDPGRSQVTKRPEDAMVFKVASLRNIVKEPYRVEGKKIMGYEIAEAFAWTLPDVIIYPTGGGTGLVGMWKAFAELEELGWLENTKRPRMVAVQAEGCAPVVKAFESGAEFCDSWLNAHTLASGLRVPKSFADALMNDLRESNGRAVAVSDESILKAQSQLGRLEGIFAAPEGAATLAALHILIDQKWISLDERDVLFNTGSGLKYLE